MCGEWLNPHNMVALHELYSVSGPPQFCTRCNRRLLLNNRSCTFCNAVYHASAVGAAIPTPAFPRPVRLRPPPLSMVDIVTDMVAMQLGMAVERDSEPRLTPLMDAARDRLLQPLPEDAAITLDPDAVCPVCLDGMADGGSTSTQLPCCRNAFHVACLTRWFTTRSTCPTCRRNLNEPVT
jgi:hypothetical protein